MFALPNPNPWGSRFSLKQICSQKYMHLFLHVTLKGRDTRCDTSPRLVAATNRLVWHVKIIVAATEFCRCDLSHKLCNISQRQTTASDVSQQQCRRGGLSPRFVALCVSALRGFPAVPSTWKTSRATQLVKTGFKTSWTMMTRPGYMYVSQWLITYTE